MRGGAGNCFSGRDSAERHFYGDLEMKRARRAHPEMMDGKGEGLKHAGGGA